jgi:hypothetical protein
MVTLFAAALVVGAATASVSAASQPCVECHQRELVAASSLQAWRDSRHAEAGVGCAACHLTAGSDQLVSLCPTAGVQREVDVPTCGACHEAEAKAFSAGGHARAWTALELARKRLPAAVAGPAMTRGCETCHRIGEDGGRCDMCHTRHAFDPDEARRPESCRSCHHGADHPEWDMYWLSRHGSIYATDGGTWAWTRDLAELYGAAAIEDSGRAKAPVCATCHLAGGRHGVTVTGGTPMLGLATGDPGWVADQNLIRDYFQLPGEAPAAVGEARRDGLLAACTGCHARSRAARGLDETLETVRECDRLTAQAVHLVVDLAREGRIRRSTTIPRSADELGLVDAPSVVEGRLWTMVLVHRKQLVLGIFHQNPDAQQGQGWRELRADLAEIRAEAAKMRGR